MHVAGLCSHLSLHSLIKKLGKWFTEVKSKPTHKFLYRENYCKTLLINQKPPTNKEIKSINFFNRIPFSLTNLSKKDKLSTKDKILK